MSDLFEKFTAFIEQHKLIRQNYYVLAAVSGGVDSIVLLHLLQQLEKSLDLRLEIIHVNHCLRGEQADRDQQFVDQLAKEHNIPIISRKVNVPKYLARKALSEEQGARFLRYRFFEWALKRTGADCVALGHQADDQVETVIDHFLRGSGVKGLCGMPIQRDKYIRPLLFATRKEIETYAKLNSLHYLIDSTNVMVKYRRNRIRHELIPYLKKHFNPSIAEGMLRSAKIMSEVEVYLNQQARIALDDCLINLKKNKIILDINSFLNYFSVIQKYTLYLLFEKAQLSRSILTAQKFDRILSLVQSRDSGKKILLPDNWQIQVNYDQLVMMKERDVDFLVPIKFNENYQLLNSEICFSAELIEKSQLPDRFPRNKQIEYIDYDKIEGQLIIRNFRPGDRFRPLNFKGEKKLSDYFIDNKIPLHQRKEIPLLVCDAGIVWIFEHQIDDRFKISSMTERILKLQMTRKNSA